MKLKMMTMMMGWALLLGGIGYGASGGLIAGAVKDPNGAPLKGAFVKAQNIETRITTSVLSDKQGRYQIPDLAPGEYRVRVDAVGYKSDPGIGVKVEGANSRSIDLTVQQGVVRWQDLSLYQAFKLLPDGTGKKELFEYCMNCHGFQRMAAVRRDSDGWQDRINYMKEISGWFMQGRVTDQNFADIKTYLTNTFGVDSDLPKSPAELSGYKDVVEQFSDEAMNIVYVEYSLPGTGRMPWGVEEDKEGKFWLPLFVHNNKIAKLDSKTGIIEEYAVPGEQSPLGVQGVAQAPDGTMWFSEAAKDRIGRFDPQTKMITQYQAPSRPGESIFDRGRTHTVKVDSQGIVWSSGTPLLRYDPKVEKFTPYWEVPWPYDVQLDKKDNVWFTEYMPKMLNGKIGKFDAKTGKIMKWAPPTADGGTRRLVLDSNGKVWFTEYYGNRIGRFDPETETFREFSITVPNASPYAIQIDGDGYVWASSKEHDLLFRLDPKTGEIVNYPAPHPDNNNHEWLKDSLGRIWWASGPNDKVGYFYLAHKKSQ
jgi:virginiamycin B lyase